MRGFSLIQMISVCKKEGALRSFFFGHFHYQVLIILNVYVVMLLTTNMFPAYPKKKLILGLKEEIHLEAAGKKNES